MRGGRAGGAGVAAAAASGEEGQAEQAGQTRAETGFSDKNFSELPVVQAAHFWVSF